MSLVRDMKVMFLGYIREKTALFWTVFFPIMLMTVMLFATSGIGNHLNIKVGVDPKSFYPAVYESIPGVEVIKMSREEGISAVKDKNINGYIDNKGEVVTYGRDSDSELIYSIQSGILQTQKSMEMGIKPSFTSVVKSNQQENNLGLTTIAGILAMVSIYSYFSAMSGMVFLQANLSYLGVRLNVSPLSKAKYVFSVILFSMALNILTNLLTLVYLYFAWNINFLSDLWGTLALLLATNAFGVGLGLFIGTSNKANSSVKTMLGVVVALIIGGMGGMYAPALKNLLDKTFPNFVEFSPGNLISSLFYRMNVIGSREGLLWAVGILFLYAAILTGASLLFIRRRRYDSL